MKELMKNDKGGALGFGIGIIGAIALLYVMLTYGIGWAWGNLMVSNTIGSAVGYGVALIVMLYLTVYAVIAAIILPIIGIMID